jgi:hypothetical protein
MEMTGRTEKAKNMNAIQLESDKRVPLVELAWQDVMEPGAYVEKKSGDLYRISKEAFFPGALPLVHKEIVQASGLVRISKDPFIAAIQARKLCVENGIEANF